MPHKLCKAVHAYEPEETNAGTRGKIWGGSIKSQHGFVCAADRRLGISRRACAESADRMAGQNCRNPAFRRTAVRPAALSVPFYTPFNGRHCRRASFSVTASAMALLLHGGSCGLFLSAVCSCGMQGRRISGSFRDSRNTQKSRRMRRKRFPVSSLRLL